MVERQEQFILYTDGGARGNPGVAGAGAMLTTPAGEILKKDFKPLGTLTNNEAEYQAVIFGLGLLKKTVGKSRAHAAQVEVRLDSELVARQLSGVYQVKEEHLWPLFMKVWNLRVADLPGLTFKHIWRGENREADALANQAMDLSSESSKLF